jgi:diacylglycerol O-acyltransferase / wax synthase
MNERIRRLTSEDASNLVYETVAAPMHIGAIATLEGGPLTDAGGALRMGVLKSRLERRLGLLPQLHRRLYRPGFLRGRPLWVDDADFSIERHVFAAAVPPPGGEEEVLAAAERILRPPLDRGRPPWELWFLTGVAGGRIELVLKLHHAITDGMGAVGLMGTLMDLEPDAADPDPVLWSPAPVPEGWQLLRDNLSGRLAGVRRAALALTDPRRLRRAVMELVSETRNAARDFTRAPRTSINGDISRGRELRAVRFSLAAAKEIAHAHAAKVNDVILDLAAGGFRTLFEARAEMVASGELIVSVPVSLRSAGSGELGNQVGAITVPLPVSEPDARRRLQLVAAAARRAKAEQKPDLVQAVMARVAATPVAHAFVTRQRMVNTFATNVMGPPVPVFLLGARVLEVLPFVPLAGNVRLSFAALSYSGTVGLLVVADAATCPDLDALTAGMAATWLELTATPVAGPRSTVSVAPRSTGPPALYPTVGGRSALASPAMRV